MYLVTRRAGESAANVLQRLSPVSSHACAAGQNQRRQLSHGRGKARQWRTREHRRRLHQRIKTTESSADLALGCPRGEQHGAQRSSLVGRCNAHHELAFRAGHGAFV